jgi:anaerobic magnesium-protoporphyrin IX monomethyl ester cyclase
MNKKVLIINPPSPYRIFPVGIAYVLACLENSGIQFDFVDMQLGKGYKALLRKNDYCAVATGGLISQYKFYNEVSRFVREIRPDIPVILGGNVTKDMNADFLFDKLHMTYGVVGEAETSLPYLIEAILGNESRLDAIPGLLYKDRQTGGIKKNPVRRLDLSTTDILPAWHKIDVDYYLNVWEFSSLGHRLCMPVLSARGCVGTCTFCSPTGGTFRKRPIEKVIQEIEFLNERYTFDWIVFLNEIFYAQKEDILSFCEAYTKVKPLKSWTCELRVDIDPGVDTFRLMKNAGCVSVYGGIESGSNRMLALMNKQTTKEQIIRFFSNAEAAGLPCQGTFMVGNEDETEDEIKETIDMVTSKELRVNQRLVITYPGTKIYEHALKRGLIVDEWRYLEHLDFICEVWDQSLSKKDYINLTDIPNEKFWEIVIRELRRFNTFNLIHYAAKNIIYEYKFGMLIRVTGMCAKCGSSVTFVTPRKMIGIKTSCKDCFRTVEFNLYELNEFNAHYRFLCAELQKAEKLAIAGTKAEASYMLKYDYFKFNYRSLIAFIEIDKKASGISDFFHLPRIRINDLPKVLPDTILIVDDHFGDAELKIRDFYLQKNLKPPRLFHLFPDDKRPYLKIIGFVRNHMTATLANKILVAQAVLLHAIISGPKELILKFVKLNYFALLRVALFRKLLEKAQQ